MADSFDPYREWLGLSVGPRPPDHYTLLEIDRFEGDPAVISRAADVQMAKIRKVRPGARLRDWGRLLDQIGAVKVCLLHPASKAAYDGSLPSGPAAAAARPSPSAAPNAALATQIAMDPNAPRPADPMAPPQASPSAPSSATPSPSESQPAATGRLRRLLILGAGAAVLVIIAGAIFALSDRNGGSEPPPVVHQSQSPQVGSQAVETQSQRPRVEPEPPPAEPKPQIKPKPPGPLPKPPATQGADPASPPREDNPPPPKPQPKPQPQPEWQPVPPRPRPPVDGARSAAFDRAVGDARAAMSRRDLAAAETHLQTAERNAQTPAQNAQLARLRTMLHNLREFWSGIRAGVAGLEPAAELPVKNTRIAIVEADRRHMVYRCAGRNYEFLVEDLPAPIVLAVADDWFDKRQPSTQVLLGTFLAVDPNGDPRQARNLWQQATGQGINCESLMPELAHSPSR